MTLSTTPPRKKYDQPGTKKKHTGTRSLLCWFCPKDKTHLRDKAWDANCCRFNKKRSSLLRASVMIIATMQTVQPTGSSSKCWFLTMKPLEEKWSAARNSKPLGCTKLSDGLARQHGTAIKWNQRKDVCLCKKHIISHYNKSNTESEESTARAWTLTLWVYSQSGRGMAPDRLKHPLYRL